MTYDVVVIGGGPAGLAAAVAAHDSGAEKVLVLERDTRLGGILLQCIHNGFGLHYFGEELTGPEYAGRFAAQVRERNIEYKTDTMVLSIDSSASAGGAASGDASASGSRSANGADSVSPLHVVTAINTTDGLMQITTRAVILSMGCRERTRGALVIPGTRPAGIFTAGSAQRFVNIDGYLPGKKVVILGSGDIGLIMARRLTLEGAEVKLVCEIMPYSAGLSRNMTQCVENFNIPVRFNTTIVEIHGTERVEGVTIASVDDHRRPIKGTEQFIACDTLLLSVGLIPENEISVEAGVRIDPVTKGPIVNQFMETSIPGIFACGNTVHVHDLVDYVTRESTRAGVAAASYVTAQQHNEGAAKHEAYALADSLANVTHTSSPSIEKRLTQHIPVRAGNRVRYTVPQHIDISDAAPLANASASAEASPQADASATANASITVNTTTTATAPEKITIMFRSTDVYRNVTVSVYSGTHSIYAKRVRIVRPGEMQTVELDANLCNSLHDSITVSIEMAEDMID